ncbi:MAG: MFS transporter [Myxococcota bacterium]|jgi:MFS family permease|nr:MFS transporter [Myxococcota bacterium]
MFYGWWIVASVFVAQMFVVGFVQYAFPFVLVAVKAEFSASTTEANLAMTASGAVGLVLSPLLGPLADRWSAKGMMVIGGFLLVAALLVLSVTQGIAQFVIVFAVMMCAANILLGPITGQAIVSRWFTTSRGRALGLTAVGTSVGGLVLPDLMSHWIEVWDWRMGLRALAGLTAVCVIPLTVFVLRDQPSDKGLEPEGAENTGTDAQAQEIGSGQGLSMAEILRNRSFWVIGLSFGLLIMSYSAFLSNIGLYVESMSLDPGVGPRLIQLVALFGLIGKIALGAATDRIDLRMGLWVALGLAGIGLAIFSTEPSLVMMWVAAPVLGLASGGVLPVWAGMVARCFGTENFGRTMGLMSPLIGLLVMPGFIIAGWSADTTGSFTDALQIYVGAIGLAGLLLFALDMDSTDGSAAAVS